MSSLRISSADSSGGAGSPSRPDFPNAPAGTQAASEKQPHPQKKPRGVATLQSAARLSLILLASVAFAQAREPWTTSRIEGTPEPARPFVHEQAYPQLAFNEGLELAAVPGSQQFLVVERRGKIFRFSTREANPTAHELIDLRTLHRQVTNAYGIVLHPRFRENRQIFICYTFAAGRPDGTRLSRFTLASLDPLRIDPASEELIITWPSGGHNGGSLQFGPDGNLYVSTGDSGPAAPPDPINTGQDTTDLLGSILRIDVDRRDAGKNYRVPPDNPWVNETARGVRPELWAFGLRNPWKLSFDAEGRLWCGDVGWELWEMVYLITRGANYGWSAYEASQPVKPHLANPLAPVSPPVVAHPHSEAASITGGFIYQGRRLPELAGAYVYGDYVTGKIWALWHNGREITRHEEIADTPHAIVTFGRDDDGEVYWLHYGDRTTVHRLARNPRAAPAAAFPRTLGATGLFADVAQHKPAAGVYPFSISTPMWQDGAEARRWIALPGTSQVVTEADVDRRGRTGVEIATEWPTGAVLARTLTLGRLAADPAQRAKPIETQILHHDGEAWNAYTYRWNEQGTEAELVPPEGAEMTLRAAADPRAAGPRTREYTWRFAGRAECLRCHNFRHEAPLGFMPSQLRGAGADQVATLGKLGIVDAAFFAPNPRSFERLSEAERPARTVLHVNCAPCHTPHAGGSVSAFFNAILPQARMNVVGVAPAQGGLGLKDGKIVDPGNPWNSALTVRMAKLGSGHMPLIGSRDVDVEGLKVIEDWIAQLPSTPGAGRPSEEVAWNATAIEGALATVSGAMRLRRAIDDGKLDAAQCATAFKIAWASPEPTVRDIFERFKPDDQRERLLGPNVDPAALLRLKGDAARGAKLVATDGKLASCQACHFIQGQGRHIGPDLSRLGATQTPAQILESILSPSKTIAPLYRASVFELRGGATQMGFVRARGVDEIVLGLPTGQSLKLKRAEVTSETTLPTSLMPEGMLQGITAQDAADLVAYLASLK